MGTFTIPHAWVREQSQPGGIYYEAEQRVAKDLAREAKLEAKAQGLVGTRPIDYPWNAANYRSGKRYANAFEVVRTSKGARVQNRNVHAKWIEWGTRGPVTIVPRRSNRSGLLVFRWKDGLYRVHQVTRGGMKAYKVLEKATRTVCRKTYY